MVGKGIAVRDRATWYLQSGSVEIPTRFVIPAGGALGPLALIAACVDMSGY